MPVTKRIHLKQTGTRQVEPAPQVLPFEKEGTFKESLIGVLGPTAVGKTRLSFYLAEKLSASILNCDSISMYKGLDIGSAKPVKEIHQAKIPLFLFDEWEPPQVGTAGAFRKKALTILKQEVKNYPVLLVGGSGFYIQALEKGMYPVGPVTEQIKKQVQTTQKEKGTEGMYQWLKSQDPEYARQISSQDSYRIYRALCLILSEKKSLSAIRTDFKEQKLPHPFLKVGLYLSRSDLLKNIQLRTEHMIKAGLLEETKTLLKKGLKDWPVMSSVGYKEVVLYLENQISKEEMKARIIHRTWKLAKKQMSWFKRDKDIHWYLLEEDSKAQIYRHIKAWIDQLF